MADPNSVVFPGRGGTPLQPQQFYSQDYVLSRGPLPVLDTRVVRPHLRSLPDQPAQQAAQTWTWSYNLNLIGQDRFPPGAVSYELTPRSSVFDGTVRGWTWSYNLNLVGQDRLPTGTQTYELTPRSSVFDGTLRSWTWSYNLNLVGKDKLPTGAQTSELTPRSSVFDGTLRAWTWWYNLNLIGQDKLPAGVQIYTLTPSQVPPEQVQLHSWQWWYNLNLTGQDRLPFRQTDWPLTPAAVQPERTVAAAYNRNLVGQDKLPFRQTDWPNPIPSADGRTWIQSVNLALTTVVVKPFAQYDWPLTPAAPQPERTIAASYNRNLTGQDLLPFRSTDRPVPLDYERSIQLRTWIDTVKLLLLVPFRQTDWPLPIPPPPPDRAFTVSFNLNLIGRDRLPSGARLFDLPAQPAPAGLQNFINTVNLALNPALFVPFNQTDWPVPRGPQQPDRGVTASYNLDLIGQDRLPNRQTDWPLSFGPQQPDRGFGISFNLNLIGQDTLPIGVRNGSGSRNSELPPQPPRRGDVPSITAGPLPLLIPPPPPTGGPIQLISFDSHVRLNPRSGPDV